MDKHTSGSTYEIASLLSAKVQSQAVYRPTIGMPIPVSQGSYGPQFMADAVCAWAIERFQGALSLTPIWPVPPTEQVFSSLWPLIHRFDGLLLPAEVLEEDWYMHWQQRHEHPTAHTWLLSWEIALAQLATYIGMPILALGTGAEKWNIALGGTVIPQQEKKRRKATHAPEAWERQSLRVKASSKIASWVQHAAHERSSQEMLTPWVVPFAPHQEIERLGQGLRSCAQSDHSHIVAFERRDPAFGLGILGRIDWCLDQWRCTAIFESFLQACRLFATVRAENDAWETTKEAMCEAVSDCVTNAQPLLLSPSSAMRERPSRSREQPDQGKPTIGHLKRTPQPTLAQLRQRKKILLKQHISAARS